MYDSERDSDDYCSDATPSTSLTDVRSGGSEKEGCLKEARLITVDGAARMAALKAKKYTKARPWPYLMPFLPDAEADEWLNETVSNLNATILMDDMPPALENHIKSLSRYMNRYGLRFCKEQHCTLIKTVYGLIVRPQQQIKIMILAGAVFVNLITGSRLTRADLILEWRSIFDLIEQLVLEEKDHTRTWNHEIQNAVVAATAFFEKGAEREIWKRIRHYVSPATIGVAISLVSLCLATTGYEKDDLEMKTGDVIDDHFLPALWQIYEREETNVNWMDSLVGFFVRLTKDSPSAVLPFFHRHLHLIFTRLTRSLGLQDREGKDNVSKATLCHVDLYQYYGKWIGYMLDTHPSVEKLLMSLLSVVESCENSSRIGYIKRWLFVPLTAIIMKRCRRELQAKQRKAEFKKNSITPISESTITAYVKAMLPILEPELQKGIPDDIRLDSTAILLGELAFLRPGLVIPKILDELYSLMSDLCKPQRFTLTLAVLKRVLILIASDRTEHDTDNDVRVPTKKDWLAERNKITLIFGSLAKKRTDRANTEGKRTGNTYFDTEAVLSLRPHLVYIAEALVDCIDTDDCIDMYSIGMDKTIAVYEVLTLLFKVMPIVNCSQTMEPSGECEEEHWLIEHSKLLKHISLRFVDKSFAIIESLKNHKDEIEIYDGWGGYEETLRPTPKRLKETSRKRLKETSSKSLKNYILEAFCIGDCSQTMEPSGECDEEHWLTELSTRLKDLSLRFVDKTIATVTALKNHKDESEACECYQKSTKPPNRLKKTAAKVLRNGILDAFCALSPDEEIGKLLCDKVLHFVRASLPLKANSAGIVRGIISACVSDHPACHDKFLKFIVNEIGKVVDEKTQKLEHVKGRAAGLAMIADGFCVLKKQDVHDHFEDLLGMAMRLLACKDYDMYEAGCRCLSGLLQSLLATSLLKPRADKRYKEGRTPSKLWGFTVDGLRTKQHWEHPVKADIEAAMKILDVSLFKEMRRLAKPELMTREKVHKSLWIVKMLFHSIVKFVPDPRCSQARIQQMCQNGLPSAQQHPTCTSHQHQLTAGEITFEGRNLRVAVCKLAEGLTTCEKSHDSATVEVLVELILTLVRFEFEYDRSYFAKPPSYVLFNHLHMERAMTLCAVREQLLFVRDRLDKRGEPFVIATDPSIFDCRVTCALFKLTFIINDRGVARYARSRLNRLMKRIPHTLREPMRLLLNGRLVNVCDDDD